MQNNTLFNALKEVVYVEAYLKNLEGFSLEEKERKILHEKICFVEKVLEEFLGVV